MTSSRAARTCRASARRSPAFELRCPHRGQASGYLQGWAQPKLSRLSFGRVAARSWDPNTGQFGAALEVRADIFVFAVQTCTDHSAYDALDTRQWEFYVVSADVVRTCGHKSLGITWVRTQAAPVGFEQLAEAVDDAWR